MLLLPVADQHKNLALFFISLGNVLIAMGSYRSPAVALMPDITPKPLRSKANSIINLMGTLGAIFTLAATSLLIPKTTHPNYTIVFISVAAFMTTAIAIFLLTIRENQIVTKNDEIKVYVPDSPNNNVIKPDILPVEMKKSLNFLLASVILWFMAYNAVTSAYSRYAVKVWDLNGGSFANPILVATAAATLSYIPIRFLSGKIGRKKTLLLSLAFYCKIYPTVHYFHIQQFFLYYRYARCLLLNTVI